MEAMSLTDFLAMAASKLGERGREYTEAEEIASLRACTAEMAVSIIKCVDDLPRLVSLVRSTEGTATFMEFESDRALFSITVSATRRPEAKRDNESETAPAQCTGDPCTCAVVDSPKAAYQPPASKPFATDVRSAFPPADTGILGDANTSPLAPWPPMDGR